MKKFDFTKQLPTYLSDRYEKEYFLIFSIIVAGRNAKMATEKTWELLKWVLPEETPFQYLQGQSLICLLQKAKIGQYNRIKRAIEDAIELDVETCTLQQLESCHGIGPKTSRFFILNTCKNAQCAVLDTHILKWLDKQIGWYIDVPKTTPSATKYLKLEQHAIRLMNKQYPNMSLAQADFEIWKSYSIK